MYLAEGLALHAEATYAEERGCLRLWACPGPAPTETEAASWLAKADHVYQGVVVYHPGFSGMDRALFGTGRVLELSGHPEAAAQRYAHLLADWPDSEYVLEARVRSAEHHLAQGRHVTATDHLREVLAQRDGGLSPLAAYLLAHVYEQRGRSERALALMRQLASALTTAKQGKTPPLTLSEPIFVEEQRSLHAALRASPRPSSLLVRASALFLEERAPSPTPTAAARALAVEGDLTASRASYEELLRDGPLAPEAPRWHYEIARLSQLLGEKGRTEEACAEIQVRYAPGSPWAEANADDLLVLRAARLIREASR